VKLYGLDIETDDPYLTDKGASWVYGAGGIIVTGLYDAQTGKRTALDGNGGKAVKAALTSKTTTLVGVNIVYDLGWLCHEHGLAAKDIQCSLIDVSIVEQFIDEYQPYSLDALAWKYLKERKGADTLKALALTKGYKGDFRRHLKKLWDAGFTNEVREYVVSDADQPVRIWERQKKIIESMYAEDQASLGKLSPAFAVQNIKASLEQNLKLIKVVLGMKQRGVRINLKKWKENSAKLAAIHTRLETEFEAAYGTVNINSPKQLAELFAREGVPFRYKIAIKGWQQDARKFSNKTDLFVGDEVWNQRSKLRDVFHGLRIKKGQLVLYVPRQYAGRTNDDLRRMGYETSCNPNIDKHVLKATKNDCPVSAALLDLKQVKNVIDKFLGPNFERFLVNGRIHADFNIVGARQTGRFSSAKPNLQNIPSKTVLYEGTEQEMNLAQACRELFLPEPGEVLVKLDFSGQENRLQAHFAVGANGDYIRLQYNENPRLDEHKFIADASGLAEEYGNKIGRKYAKNLRFGMGYGMQINTMTENFNWEREQAEHMLELYEEAAPWVRETMEKVQQVVVKRRYIKTLMGRRAHLRPGRDRDAYKFYNYVVQGSAADMTKAATVKISESETVEKLLLTVHDENVFSVPRTKAGMMRVIELQKCMEHSVVLSVPIICDPEVGRNWHDVAGQREKKDSDGNVIAIEPLERFLAREMKLKQKEKTA
jgi:DNA polymerase I-like protein with 3'-5' exonuclease and polymerase domains